jgi:hypothetical protein
MSMNRILSRSISMTLRISILITAASGAIALSACVGATAGGESEPAPPSIAGLDISDVPEEDPIGDAELAQVTASPAFVAALATLAEQGEEPVMEAGVKVLREGPEGMFQEQSRTKVCKHKSYIEYKEVFLRCGC